MFGSSAPSGEQLLRAEIGYAGATAILVALLGALYRRGTPRAGGLGAIKPQAASTDAAIYPTRAMPALRPPRSCISWRARVDRAAPVGLTDITLSFDVDCDADAAKLQRMIATTERYCVIYQTIKSAPVLTAEVQRVSSDSPGA